MASALCNKSSLRASVAPRVQSRRAVVVRAGLEPQIVIGGSTAALLAIGRFVFLPYQRREAARASIAPKTAGTTFFDDLQKPSSFVTSTNDPAGFNVIDVLGWGALGHVVGFAALALNSLQNTPL